MTYQDALAAARRINRVYGPCVVFREPSKKKSYQAIAGTAANLPPGARLITSFAAGEVERESRTAAGSLD